MNQQELNDYWNKRKYKKYVVRLVGRRKVDFKIVRAKTRKGAEKTAIENSILKGKIFVSDVRYATPHDLGAIKK